MRSTPRPPAPVLALALLLLAAGCLSGAPGETPTASATTTPTANTTTTPTDAPATERYSPGARAPDPHHAVTVGNRWSERVAIHVRVVRRATNETVHEGTATLPPGTERTVYDTARADPDGIEAFAVVASARNRTDRVTIETSACYGDVHATVREDGEFGLVYAVC